MSLYGIFIYICNYVLIVHGVFQYSKCIVCSEYMCTWQNQLKGQGFNNFLTQLERGVFGVPVPTHPGGGRKCVHLVHQLSHLHCCGVGLF